MFRVSLSQRAFCLVWVVCFSFSLYGQVPTKQWDKTIGGSGTETLNKSIRTSDGGYLLAGTTDSGMSGDKTQEGRGGLDYWIVKTDSNGTKQWDRSFGTSENDDLQAVIQTSDGGYLLGGSNASGVSVDRTQDSRGGNDYWIVKVNREGAKQWDKRFGGDENDRLFEVLETADGGYLLGGVSNSEANGDKTDNSLVGSDASFRNWHDFWIIKLSSEGAKQWDNTVGSYYEDDYLSSLLATTDGGYLIGGNRFWPCYCSEDGTSYELVKVDQQGGFQWTKYFGGEGLDDLAAVVQTTDGGYLLAGSSNSNVSPTKSHPLIGGAGDYGPWDYWLVKVTDKGEEQWDNVYGTAGNDQLTSLLQTPDGGYLLGGYSDGGLEYDKTEASRGGTDYWLVKVHPNGIRQWDKTLGGLGNEVSSTLLLTADQGYLLTGTSASDISGEKTQASKGSTDFWLVKTDGKEVVPACSATGTIGREYWANVPGVAVSAIPFNNPPTTISQLSSFEAPANVGDQYGQRISGYLCVPTSGRYTFYLAADDNAELYLSPDDQATHKTRIAHITGLGGWAHPRQWHKYASQQSASIALEAGKPYYIEALHKEGGGEDHVAVGWLVPNSTAIAVIPGSRLFPVTPPVVQLTSPVNNVPFLPGSLIVMNVTVAAVDPQATITKVEFFRDTTKLGEDTRFPYGLEWTASSVGRYQLTAKATDSRGIVGFSAPVIVIIDEKAAVRKQWDKTLGGSETDGCFVVLPLADGGYLLGGDSYSGMSGDKSQPSNGENDYWIVKVDSNGVKQWDKTFGGSSDDGLSSMIKTSDGGYLLGGTSSSGISGDKSQGSKGQHDFWIVKLNSVGVKQWDKAFGGRFDDDLKSVIVTSDGGYLLGGSSYSGVSGDKSQANKGAADYWIVKVDSNGVKQWDKTFGGDGYDFPSSLIETSDGGYLLGGNSASGMNGGKSQINKGQNDYWIVKVNSSGIKQWDKAFGGSSSDYLWALLPATDGGYLLGGTSYSDKSGDKSEDNHVGSLGNATDIWVVKLNRNGIKQWDRTYGGGDAGALGSNELSSLIQSDDGGYLLGGSSQSGISGDRTEANRGSTDYWVVKITDAGTKVWDRAFGGSDSEQLLSMLHTSDGGLVLAGRSYSGISGEKSEVNRGGGDFWIVKTYPDDLPSCSASGTILREVWSNVPGNYIRDIPLSSPPTTISQVTSFAGPSNVADFYAARYRGYLCVPQTGQYTFFLASDNEGELWLSTDEDPAHKAPIAYLHNAYAWSYTDYPSQRSVSIALQAGQRYYIEALHKEGSGGDKLSVGWLRPGSLTDATPTVIKGSFLSPFEESDASTRTAHTEAGEPSLLKAYPNPATGLMTIEFTARQTGWLGVHLYDLQGRPLQQLFGEEVEAGSVHQQPLDTAPLKAGLYLLRMVNGPHSQQQKVMVTR